MLSSMIKPLPGDSRGADSATATGSHRDPGSDQDSALQLADRGGVCRLDEAVVLFHGMRHPREMGQQEIAQFLSTLAVRDRARLRRHYGQGRWRKLKGIACVRLVDGTIRLAEFHWYEGHGIGKRELKLKLPFLD